MTVQPSDATEILDQLKRLPTDDESACLLIRQLGRSGFFEAKAEVARFFDSRDPCAQVEAIICLFFYWGKGKEYEDIITRMAFHDLGIDEEVRHYAITAKGLLYEGTSNAQVINQMIDVLCDVANDESARESAYLAILNVLGVPTREWPSSAKEWDFAVDVDWDLIDRWKHSQ